MFQRYFLYTISGESTVDTTATSGSISEEDITPIISYDIYNEDMKYIGWISIDVTLNAEFVLDDFDFDIRFLAIPKQNKIDPKFEDKIFKTVEELLIYFEKSYEECK